MIRPRWEIVNRHKAGSAQEVLEILLANRQTGTDFITGSLKDLEVHLSMQGIAEGAQLMCWHLAKGHKVVLVGDYDCDGITSAAQLALFLRDIGHLNHTVVIPQRSEGYGVPQRAISANADAKLLVTLDCGTLDKDTIGLARSIGMDCIVIDHHEAPAAGLAPANVIINPKQHSCPSSFKEFASAGLTLIFLAALRRTMQHKFPRLRLGSKYLALAAIGTVADIAPLVNANRILAKVGLYHLAQGAFPPLTQLINAAGLGGKNLTAGHIGYYIGPRLNAAGRMASAQLAFDLLMENDPGKIAQLVQELNRLNSKRQLQQESIFAEVTNRYSHLAASGRSVVMGDSNWPTGIVGIIASRIQQELHYGPTIVFSIDEEGGIARGSARSIPGIDIHTALKSCERELIRWGGHKMAAGLTCELSRMEKFADLFERAMCHYAQDIFIPRAKVDMELDLGLVGPPLFEALKQLEPHGPGNSTPTFVARGVKTQVQKAFGTNGEHLQMVVAEDCRGVFWRGSRRLDWGGSEAADVIFQLQWDHFRNAPSLNIKDIGRFFQNQ
ncbi:single-stranded-DNA-specific exonuclease RecJ [Desulfoferrobacter suflitae]|uniref:single-stranded-DNA-specific exonuclease RecJ n=1 Tax=Desulfoferrobacter suflitae TaxID=2865782 RepID=UPI0021644136|nr:single-stranded-DNA-specific exonuclease RecJ [Desulfoferrobacter suflitae]MCK8601057.1 single-stranded-DNA-specific exonuclease RecJ [Desulfoferrobacter suflitae]